MKSWVLFLIAVVLSLAFGAVAALGVDRLFLWPAPPQIDTLTIRDTIRVDSPMPESVVPAGFELVPAGTSLALRRSFATIAELRDSLGREPEVVTVHDTAFIVVPLREYTFGDGKTYEMAVRGYDVSLLWHKAFTETVVVTQTRDVFRDYRWTLYPRAGLLSYPGGVGALAAVGADISVSPNRRWRVVPEAGYGAFFANNQLAHGFYASASIKFNLIQVK